MAGNLQGRVAIVTGSGQGIGKAIALGMAREGASVVTNSRRAGSTGGDAETTAREITAAGGRALACYADVSSFAEAQALVQKTVEAFGRVDILVNNAGVITGNMVWDMTEDEWESVIQISLKGSFNCIRHVAGLMINKKWGRIINTSSIAWLGTAGRASYNAAKAGLVGLTRGVAREVGGYGVTCNAYTPSAATRVTTNPHTLGVYKKRYEMGLYTKQQYESVLNPPPAETIPPLLIYLCTEAAADINGQVFDIRGGEISIYSEPVKKSTIVKEQGLWTVGELIEAVPAGLLAGYRNPAPPEKH